MRSERLLKRLARLDWSDRLMLAEAFVAITAASMAVRLLPFDRAIRLGSRRLSNVGIANDGEVCAAARWSVRAVARRLPWRAVCFQQGLALQWMLRRRGIDARLHYGIGKGGVGELCAHVWISAGQAVVLGGEDAAAFQAVAVYP